MYLLYGLIEHSSVWKLGVAVSRKDDKPCQELISNEASFPLCCWSLTACKYRVVVLNHACVLPSKPVCYLAKLPLQTHLTFTVAENFYTPLGKCCLIRKFLREGFQPKPNKFFILHISEPSSAVNEKLEGGSGLN